jgi:hypothetical protein
MNAECGASTFADMLGAFGMTAIKQQLWVVVAC